MPNIGHNAQSPNWTTWLLCRFDDDGILHSKSFFVKRRSQPMEEHRPKKLLDQSSLECVTRILGSPADPK